MKLCFLYYFPTAIHHAPTVILSTVFEINYSRKPMTKEDRLQSQRHVPIRTLNPKFPSICLETKSEAEEQLLL